MPNRHNLKSASDFRFDDALLKVRSAVWRYQTRIILGEVRGVEARIRCLIGLEHRAFRVRLATIHANLTALKKHCIASPISLCRTPLLRPIAPLPTSRQRSPMHVDFNRPAIERCNRHAGRPDRCADGSAALRSGRSTAIVTTALSNRLAVLTKFASFHHSKEKPQCHCYPKSSTNPSDQCLHPSGLKYNCNPDRSVRRFHQALRADDVVEQSPWLCLQLRTATSRTF